LDPAAADLLRIGEVLAEKYRQQRMKKVEDHIRDLPFLKQRGH
jgi:hypothetical protein